jgi:hypothetical protein
MAGAGLSHISAEYKTGYGEQMAATSAFGVLNLEAEIDDDVGFHIQLGVVGVLPTGVTLGLHFRHTIAEADVTLYRFDAILLEPFSGTDEMDLGSTEIAFSIGARF